MPRSSYRDHDYAFGQMMLTLRSATELTQAELASRLTVSRQSVADWEAGRKYPKANHLQAFIRVITEHGGFSAGRDVEAIRALWEAAHQKVLIDEIWLSRLTTQYPDAAEDSLQASGKRQHVDWDAAMSIPSFFGREPELRVLTDWVLNESVQIVTLLGLGGIGKSALAVQFMHHIVSDFEVVIWRSLRDAPTDEEFFTDLLQVIAPQSLMEAHVSPERLQAILLNHLRTTRILLVLDNLESLLERENVGQLTPEHEGFTRFLHQSAETKHQSCIVLTSREKPKDLIPFEGFQGPVRTLRLAHLDFKACEQLLNEKRIVGSAVEYAQLIDAYAGNPLALKIVSQTIIELFDGDLASFLEHGEVMFGSIVELLTAQFSRLSSLEQTVIIWLAILREPSSINDLSAVLAFPLPRLQLLEAFETLYRRSLLERGNLQGSFTLQSVVLEYITVHLIAELTAEIVSGQLRRLFEHSIELAYVREYIRQTQERLLAVPLRAQLQSALPRHIHLEDRLKALLDQFRTQPHSAHGYAPANIMMLLRLLNGNLRETDLSHLMLRGISLQGIEMQDASLAHGFLLDSVFTEAFDVVITVTTSSRSDYWAASSRRGEVRIWTEHGLVLHRAWRAHLDLIMALAFSSDGQKLATGSWDRSVKVWDVATGDLLWTGWHNGELVRLAFSPDDRVVSSNGGTEVILWNAEDGTLLEKLPIGTTPTGVVWSRAGHLLVTSDLEGTIVIWSPQISAVSRLLVIHAASVPITGLAFSADDSVLASSGNDTDIKLWNVETGELIDSLQGHTDRVRRVAWSPDGRTIASASLDQTIWLWDFETSKCRAVLHGHSAEVWSIAFSSDGKSLFSGSADGTLRVWDVGSGRCIRMIQSYATTVFTIDWSPDGKQLVSGGANIPVTLWDVVGSTPPHILSNLPTVTSSLGWSSDGRYIASSDWNHAIRLWDPVLQRLSETLQPPDENGQMLYNLKWRPNGQQLAWGTYNNAVVVFDVPTHSYQITGKDFPTRLRLVEWSADGRFVAGCGYNSIIYIWDSLNFQLVQQITGHQGMIMWLAWKPDGLCLAAGGSSISGGDFTIWNLERDESEQTIDGLDYAVSAGAWDVDNETLITGSSDGNLHWWNTNSAEVIAVRGGHEGMIHAIRFNPERTMLASCSNDGAIVLWEAHHRERIRTLRHDRPYERLDITGLQGISETQKILLLSLGAVEKP